ncbi:MAG TPA: 2OG-Fe dioxygenase family protein, partial [Ramlibacter sp.]
MLLRPAYTYPDQVTALLRQQGYAVLSPSGVAEWSGCALDQLAPLQAAWDDLPPDAYLKDGGRYRRRRHSCFVAQDGALLPAPHRAHWQPVEYNALHGGMQRWFEPMDVAVANAPAWTCLLQALAREASALRGARPWFIEAHQFRIDTEGGIGRPTPEGAHRDGVDFVAVFLVGRHGIKGGETRVFQAD